MDEIFHHSPEFSSSYRYITTTRLLSCQISYSKCPFYLILSDYEHTKLQFSVDCLWCRFRIIAWSTIISFDVNRSSSSVHISSKLSRTNAVLPRKYLGNTWWALRPKQAVSVEAAAGGRARCHSRGTRPPTQGIRITWQKDSPQIINKTYLSQRGTHHWRNSNKDVKSTHRMVMARRNCYFIGIKDIISICRRKAIQEGGDS